MSMVDRTAYSKVSGEEPDRSAVRSSRAPRRLPGGSPPLSDHPTAFASKRHHAEGDDPFVDFTEWAGNADEEDYANL